MHRSLFSLDEELDEFGTEEEFADPPEEFDEEDEEEFENELFGDSILDLAEQSMESICDALPGWLAPNSLASLPPQRF